MKPRHGLGRLLSAVSRTKGPITFGHPMKPRTGDKEGDEREQPI